VCIVSPFPIEGLAAPGSLADAATRHVGVLIRERVPHLPRFQQQQHRHAAAGSKKSQNGHDRVDPRSRLLAQEP